jgi:isopenicillin-N epimerase
MHHLWNLDPEVHFLNHGSFGACPLEVLEVQRGFQNALEREPIRFLAPERELEPKLDFVRSEVARLVSVDPQDIAWVRNATEGVNTVLRSLRFSAGDEVIISDHGYNACNNAARFAMEHVGGVVQTVAIPFPLKDSQQIIDAFVAAFSPRTRLIVIDHVTSPTGIVFPVEQIIAEAHQRDIRVLVDGAHAPGMLAVNLSQLDVDYYTSNHHKWLCGPKASGFLYVRRELQDEIRPLVISHAANRPRPGRSRFLAEFDWQGTYDPSALLSVPAAIAFLEKHRRVGLSEHMHENHTLAVRARQWIIDAIGGSIPAPASMIGSTATIPLPSAPAPPDGQIDLLQRRLFDHYRIEVPVFRWPDPQTRWLRISAQSYNHLDQYQYLAEALVSEQVTFHC